MKDNSFLSYKNAKNMICNSKIAPLSNLKRCNECKVDFFNEECFEFHKKVSCVQIYNVYRFPKNPCCFLPNIDQMPKAVKVSKMWETYDVFWNPSNKR